MAKEAIEELVSSVLPSLVSFSTEDTRWIIKSLSSYRKKWFVQLLFDSVELLPDDFFLPLVKAAIYETDPSYNREFVYPCIRIFGRRRTSEALLEFVSTGTNFEKAGAINALYWALGSTDAGDDLEDIYFRRRCIYLQEFVSNRNLNVQRSLIPNLIFDIQQYPEHLVPLVRKAIQIARGHPDSYIHRRIQNELGELDVLDPLPHRMNPTSLIGKLLSYFS